MSELVDGKYQPVLRGRGFVADDTLVYRDAVRATLFLDQVTITISSPVVVRKLDKNELGLRLVSLR